MTSCRLVWANYRLFAYEKEFALREVQALLPGPIQHVTGGLEVPFSPDSLSSLSRLTYFREVVLPDGTVIIPDQAKLEASAREDATQAKRQSTRYSAHGLHEYKGKFNPQVVRSIANMMNLPQNAWLLDPFCGSGTTLLESAHSGWNAVGTDLNPLAVKISNAKIQAVKATATDLQGAADQLAEALETHTAGITYEAAWSEREIEAAFGPRWMDRLPNQEYLKSWFPLSVLAQLSLILGEIDRLVPQNLRGVFQVVLSDLIRDVSLQDPGDLRIRRRKDPLGNYPAIPMFLDAMKAKLLTIGRAKPTIGALCGHQEAFRADNRVALEQVTSHLPESLQFEAFDGAITSPPYVTALPYIDTQRLSLAVLGLINAKDIMMLERALTGTREIVDKKRRLLEKALTTAPDQHLPKSVITLCQRMLSLSELPGNGFRRRNMPSLTYGYFDDMAKVFRSVAGVMRQGGTFALVVGHNRTELGGEKIMIDTPQLLADVACINGWRLKDMIGLETYHRFDMHSKNSITTENLILLEKP